MLDEKDDGSKIISEEELSGVHGGFSQVFKKDKYDENTYRMYGVTWTPHKLMPDEYEETSTGRKLTQEQAEALVTERMQAIAENRPGCRDWLFV